LEYVKDNLAKTWKILKSLISPSSRKETFDEIVHNDKIIRDPKQIADKFNIFFASVGPNLAAKIPKSLDNFESYLKSKTASKYSSNLLMSLKFKL
jgi:hypothetical protein